MSFVGELYAFIRNRRFRRRYPQNESYSQEGEDSILSRYFEVHSPVSRFYVDVGAHHPVRFSNTYLFYRRGWRGINVEPNPDMASDFQIVRPRDINLMVGIARTAGTLRYYRFNEPALNTFDAKRASAAQENSSYRVVEEADVPVRPLTSVLAEHLPPRTVIDFMSIDVEGLDLTVLQSNDWQLFRPRVLLVEDLQNTIQSATRSEIGVHLTNIGYRLWAKTVHTFFYEIAPPT